MKTKGGQTGLQTGNVRRRGGPPSPLFFVSMESKGVVQVGFVSMSSKGVSGPSFAEATAGMGLVASVHAA
jgi:hypothetical protein